MMYGTGTFTSADGSSYNGKFVEGKRHGKGTRVNENPHN